jgi:hypothetical protein
VCLKAGLDGYGKFRPHRDSIPGPSSSSDSLYLLRYPGRYGQEGANEFLEDGHEFRIGFHPALSTGGPLHAVAVTAAAISRV